MSLEKSLEVIGEQNDTINQLRRRVHELRSGLLYATDILEQENVEITDEDERALSVVGYNEQTDPITI